MALDIHYVVSSPEKLTKLSGLMDKFRRDVILSGGDYSVIVQEVPSKGIVSVRPDDSRTVGAVLLTRHGGRLVGSPEENRIEEATPDDVTIRLGEDRFCVHYRA